MTSSGKRKYLAKRSDEGAVTRIAPFVAMVCSAFVAGFLGGTLTAHFDVFPYPSIRDAELTLRSLVNTLRASPREDFEVPVVWTTLPAKDAPTARWQILDTTTRRFPVTAYGGRNQYLELCPDQGCVAVTFGTKGNVTEKWPYHPDAIYDADIVGGDYPHETLMFDPLNSVYPVSVQRYSDGDILVNFQSRGAVFPFAAGVSRIAPDGTPRWTRFDFSHHWSTLRSDGVAYVPGLKVGDESVSFIHHSEPRQTRHTLDCKSDRPQLDTIQRIGGDGRVIEEIELVPLFLKSNWAGLLPETTDPCDPLHLNYIDQIGADAGPGLAKGDLVLSLRNISRFVIFDPELRKIKRVISGGFVQQHSVRHLVESKFLIFDNRGGDSFGPASRVVELDLATGAERRIFPNADTPEAYAKVFTDTAGFLDISPDRRRVLASFTHEGRAFEIDIASGRLLAVFDNLHDASSVSEVPEDERGRAGRFSLYGMSYASQ